MSLRLKNLLGTAIVFVLAASAAYSANFAGFRDALPPPSRYVNAGAIDRDPATEADGARTRSLRSFPWWATVAAFDGNGPVTTDRFSIDTFALQWRVNWSCELGRMTIEARRDGSDPVHPALADTTCPSEAVGVSVEPGSFALFVETQGRWEATVEQQVDVPLVEPLTAEMSQGRVVATGALYDMDRRGSGMLAIYRLRDGSHMLRFEDVYVTPNVDLEIHVSSVGRPTSSDGFTRAGHEHVAMMPVTTGSINYEIPDHVDLADWRSIVIWCEPLQLAYAGATLERVR